jgi:hypothetical protein
MKYVKQSVGKPRSSMVIVSTILDSALVG